MTTWGIYNMDNRESYIAKASGLKTGDYIAYALGDVGCCLVFALVTNLLQTFYTDVLFLNPLFIMIMFVAARVWDAINDPIMGRICDSIKTSKWGRYRPWFLWAAAPLIVSTVLLFVNFWGNNAENAGVAIAIYATVTYILFGMSYTMLQIPYGSLANVVTADEKERTKLSVFRSAGAVIGNFPAMIIGFIWLDKDGHIIYPVLIIGVTVTCILAGLALLFAFKGNIERIERGPAVKEKGAVGKAFKRLLNNRSMISLAIASMLLIAGQMFTQSFYIYLIRNYFRRPGLTMLPTVFSYLPVAVLMFFTPKLVRRFGKKEVCGFGMAVSAVCSMGMFALKFADPGIAFWPFMVLCLLAGFGFNFFVLQVWAMVTDAIDDLEVETGSKEDGTSYSFIMFFKKLGQVVAAIAVNGSLLAMNYVVGQKEAVEFTHTQLGTMFDLATLIPAILFGLMALVLILWYPLSKKNVELLQEQKEEMLKEILE